MLTPWLREARERVSARLLVAGNVLAWGFEGIAFAPGEDPAAIWPGLAEALYRIRRADKLDGQPAIVMVKDLTDGARAPSLQGEALTLRVVEC